MSGAPSRLPALTVTVARFAAVPGMTLALPPRRRGALQGADGVLVPVAQAQITAPTGKAVVADGGMVTVTGLP
jgi:hypothetical protein